MLSSKPLMTYFDTEKETTIITDAGPTGLSAILLQHTKHNTDYQIIAYLSRTLTNVEQRYSQIEKECLGILHGCEKFRMYLLGGPFTVLTDHIPLVTLLNNSNTTIPLRIERWSLRLQEYHFDIKHIQEKFNPADYCSRRTTSTTTSITSMVTEAYLNFVLEHAKPIAVSLDEIRESTKQDATLTTLINLISPNTWHSLDHQNEKFIGCNLHELKTYRRIAHELTVTADE